MHRSINYCHFLLAVCISSPFALAGEMSEVATGTLSCNAQWNEFCEDQKTIKVPEGHKLCKHSITVKEQIGDSSYELVSVDNNAIIVKFHAKGNRDRFKQQSSSIVLSIALYGVREDSECLANDVVQKNSLPPIQNSPSVDVKAATKPEAAIPSTTTPIVTPVAPAVITQMPKPHACACSKWIDADRVANCLAAGHGRDNVTCDSFAAAIQCVATRDECRESQKEDCYQVMGLNQSTSQKRIFVADSPYCNKK